MDSENFYESVINCPKQLPRPKVRNAQVKPLEDADTDHSREPGAASKKDAEYARTILPPAYQYDNPVYDGGKGHMTTGHHNEAVSQEKSGCCDKRCAIISLLLVLLLLAGLTIAVLVVIYKPDDNGGETTPSATTTAVPTTPVVTGWTEWAAWSECGVTCGGGYRSRSRTCNPPENECIGPQNQTVLCSTNRCPLPEYGDWSSWTGWSECSDTCGGGTQFRSRTCNQDPDELPCPGDLQQERDCNEWECPSCQRTCPDGGDGNEPACDRCLCANNPNFQGLVADKNNLPLEGVTVADSYYPGVVLDTSDENGAFVIIDACSGIDLVFKKVNYVTSTLVIGSNTSVKMDRVEHLSISGDPVDKQRLVGESVSFCCNVTGKPLPDYVEWFQDGGILATLPYDGNASFTIHNVNTNHEGYYRCRANNDYSSVYSENARLTVKESSNAFCSGDPSPNPIPLPVGCTYNGQVTVDVGYCAPLPCRQITSGSDSCWMDQPSCCGPTEYQILEIDCDSFILPTKTVKTCGCSVCAKRVIIVVGRVIATEDQSPVKFAEVVINGTVVEQTDSNGDFQLSLPTGTRSVSLTIRDNAYRILVETTKVMHFPQTADGTYYVYIEMMPVREHSEFDPSTGEAFFLGGQGNPFAAVIIPPGEFYTLDGSPVSDIIEAHLTFMDPRNRSDVQNAPGDLSFVDPEGNRQLLQTYGMFSLSFRSKSSQEKLQFQDKAIFVLNRANIPQNSSTPKLWSLNQNTGNWKDEGDMNNDTNLLTLVPTKFHGFISSFSDYSIGGADISVDYTWNNFDGQSERACHSKVRAFENDRFEKSSQLEGFQIEVLVKEGDVYSASDIRAFSDNGIDTNGYCVVHLCERQPGTADYTAALLGYQGNDPNENRLKPALSENSGIDKDTMDAINYNAIDHDFYGAIEYKPMLHKMVNKKGPLYDWDGFDKGIKDWAYSEACSSASMEDGNHFRLYAEEFQRNPCSREYNVQDVPNCEKHSDGEILNPLSWYSEAHVSDTYRTCYVKVLVEDGKDNTFRAVSRMGNVTLGDNKKFRPYGFRDECPTKSTGAVCLEVKHSSYITDCTYTLEDETFVQIKHEPRNGSTNVCKRTAINENIQIALGDHLIDLNDDSMFQIFMKSRNYGSLFGIYCEQRSDSSIEEVQQLALARCMNGTDQRYCRMPNESNEENWAVKFECNKS